jgi:hypothetical protein
MRRAAMRLIVPYLYYKRASGVAVLTERPSQPAVEPAQKGFGRPLSEQPPEEQRRLMSEAVAAPAAAE